MSFLVYDFTRCFCFLSHTGCVNNPDEDCHDVNPKYKFFYLIYDLFNSHD